MKEKKKQKITKQRKMIGRTVMKKMRKKGEE